MGDRTRVHLFVSGRVQGVLFRRHAQGKARELRITGWAHNLLDGTVEIVCEGDKERIKEFVDWCKRGPSLAKVEHVDVSFEKYRGEFSSFEVREFGF